MPSRRPLVAFLIATGLIAALLPATAHAGKMTLGAAIGSNKASFSGYVPPNSSYESIRGFAGGLFFDFYVKDDVAISIQPMYVPGGADQVWTQNDVETRRVEYQTNYLSIPLALKITGSSRSRMYVQGSIDFNFLLDGEVTEDGQSVTITDELQSFGLGTSFAVGGLIAIGHNYLMIEGRYSQGLSNIAGDQDNPYGQPVSIKSTGFLFLVGWLFQLGGSAQ